MDSCSSWSPSLSSEALTPLETILPSVESVLQEPIMGFRAKDHGTLGQFCASPSCEDEDGFSSGFSNETLAHNESTIKPSFLCVPTSHLGDSPQCSESQIPETRCVTTKPSHTEGETSSVLSLQESANCGTIGLAKRPKVDQSEAPSKAQMSQNQVRKLGEKITALQQLVSPFGKTDTASVLLEAIGYIKFLQEQVHVLSSPYMTSSVSERKGCEAGTDLRSRGLCLVPISCTMNVANSNGADYWISSISGCSR